MAAPRANSRFFRFQQALFLLTPWSSLVGGADGYGVAPGATFPDTMTIRASVITETIPVAYYDEAYTPPDGDNDPFPHYRGFQPDLMRELVQIAAGIDNVTLIFELEQAPPGSYNQQFSYLANDCGVRRGTTLPHITHDDGTKPLVHSMEDCNRLDMVIGDFYSTPDRSIRAQFTPPILRSNAATVHYIHRSQRAISTLLEAQTLNQPVCVVEGLPYDKHIEKMQKFPDIEYLRCPNYDECIDWLKQEKCALFLEDELELRHTATKDASLEVTPENFNIQLISWPMSARLDPLQQQLIIRWMYEAHQKGIVDSLYHKYFAIESCPLGRAGVNCDEPCSATHGVSDRDGNCVCDSTRWTGDDCSEEVEEDKNLIPTWLLATCYTMACLNFLLITFCACWLYRHRRTAQVKVAQPFFLSLVLLGCTISTSSIFVFVQQDATSTGGVYVPFCMLMPWFYSIGFCITFGSLFAKIRRVYKLFKAAATMTRATVTAKETILVVGGILMIDVTILTVWTLTDPWEWQRVSLTEDKYGYTLSSEGFCMSDHFTIFIGVLGAFHLFVMGVACYMIYVSRDIPTQFSEGKYVALAVLSNIQIFLIVVPIVILLDGSDSTTGVFVRCIGVYLNDSAIISLIFGNLIYSLHFDQRARSRSPSGKSMIRRAMKSFTRRRNERTLMLGDRSRSMSGVPDSIPSPASAPLGLSNALVPVSPSAATSSAAAARRKDDTPDPESKPRLSKGTKSVRFTNDDPPASPQATPPPSTSTEFTDPQEIHHTESNHATEQDDNINYGIPAPIPPRPPPPAILLDVLEDDKPHTRMSSSRSFKGLD